MIPMIKKEYICQKCKRTHISKSNAPFTGNTEDLDSGKQFCPEISINFLPKKQTNVLNLDQKKSPKSHEITKNLKEIPFLFPIQIKTKDGTNTINALLDTGAEDTFISYKCMSMIHPDRKSVV